MKILLRLYMTVRKPRNFLILLTVFIATSLLFHFLGSYDADFGATNLVLSIEASTASAVLMMIAEESSAWQQEHTEAQSRMLASLLAVEEKHEQILLGLQALDERILNAITKENQS